MPRAAPCWLADVQVKDESPPTYHCISGHTVVFLLPEHLEEKQEHEQELYRLSKPMTLYAITTGIVPGRSVRAIQRKRICNGFS